MVIEKDESEELMIEDCEMMIEDEQSWWMRTVNRWWLWVDGWEWRKWVDEYGWVDKDCKMIN